MQTKRTAPVTLLLLGLAVAEEIRHVLSHAIPNLAEVLIHVEPWRSLEVSNHATLHHEPVPTLLTTGN